jgi:putative lipoic acid-binding regulatory protein
MQSAEELRLIQLLDERHTWPCIYAFKFIVPESCAQKVRDAIPEASTVESRPSSGGKYTALTLHCAVASSREVLSIYSRVRDIQIPGLIAL